MLKEFISFLIVGSLTLPGFAAAAGTVQLPATNQVTCFDANGDLLPACSATGQDGEKMAGVAWQAPRFTDNSNGTVTDNLTGLFWSQHANAPSRALSSDTPNGCANAENEMPWVDALGFIGCLNMNNHAGFSDWRLPNLHELEGMVNAGVADSSVFLNDNGFGLSGLPDTQVQPSPYWTSTSDASALDTQSAAAAWYVDLAAKGDVPGSIIVSTLKNDQPRRVWPVRGNSTGSARLWKTGQAECYNDVGELIPCSGTGEDGDLLAGAAWPVPRFTKNIGNTYAFDKLTGLVWTTSTQTPGPASCAVSDPNLDWQQALDHVACLNTEGYLGRSDWRLPNRKELGSLVDYSKGNPALPAGNPFDDLDGLTYWSSTSVTSAPMDAMTVSMYDGGISGATKAGTLLPAWPVSGPDVDLEPPALDISEGDLTTKVAIQRISGSVEAGATVHVSVNNGASVAASVTGTAWNFTINPLAQGVNTVIVSAANLAGYLSTASISITLDTRAPNLGINQGDMTTKLASKTIGGTVEAGAQVKVSVNGGNREAANVTGTAWSYTVNPLAEGVNKVTVTATDLAGNLSVDSININLDTVAPVLAINQGNMTTKLGSQTISGTVEAGVPVVKVSVNGGTAVAASLTATGWIYTLPLAQGVNTVTVSAADLAGNLSTESISITLDSVAPSLSINPVASRTNKKVHALSGTVEAGATVAVTTGGQTLPATITGTTWSFAVNGLATGDNTFIVVATDAMGNMSPHAANINYVTPDGIISGGSVAGIGDALKALRIAVKIIPASTDDLLHGDVAPLGAPDDKIDVADALVILKKVIGLPAI